MSVGAVNKQTGDRIPTAGRLAVDAVLSGTSTNPVQNRVVKEALDGKADTDMVAADFNAGTSYTTGNYCIYEGKFYKFKNNHSGAWAAADVDEIKIAGELSSLNSNLTNKATVTDLTNSVTINEGVSHVTVNRIGNAVFVNCHATVLIETSIISGLPAAIDSVTSIGENAYIGRNSTTIVANEDLNDKSVCLWYFTT